MSFAPSHVTITLPEPLHEFVNSQVRSGGFNSAEEYVQSLLQREQCRTAEHTLEALLLEGIESGPAEPMTKADWDRIRAEVRERLSRSASDDA